MKTIDSKQINKISDIPKEVECFLCERGTRKIEYFVVQLNGKLSARYGICSTPGCPEREGIRYPTSIVIRSLQMQNKEQKSIKEMTSLCEERVLCFSKNCTFPDHIEHKHEGYENWHLKSIVHNEENIKNNYHENVET